MSKKHTTTQYLRNGIFKLDTILARGAIKIKPDLANRNFETYLVDVVIPPFLPCSQPSMKLFLS